jgi:hypothetical protein
VCRDGAVVQRDAAVVAVVAGLAAFVGSTVGFVFAGKTGPGTIGSECSQRDDAASQCHGESTLQAKRAWGMSDCTIDAVGYPQVVNSHVVPGDRPSHGCRCRSAVHQRAM